MNNEEVEIVMLKKDIETLQNNFKDLKGIFKDMNNEVKEEIKNLRTNQNKMLWTTIGGLGVTLLTLATILFK